MIAQQKSKSNLESHSALLNEFFLTPLHIQSLKHHYILHWTGHYLESRISRTGIITHQDISYIAILPECTRKKFFEAPWVKLSFRDPREEFKYDPYVLIRFANSPNIPLIPLTTQG